MRMVRGREHFRFALKPREPIVVSGERGRQNLDCDLAFQLRVRRAKHLPHPAFADLRGDVVDTEACAGSEGQTVGSIAVSLARTRSILCNGVAATEGSSTIAGWRQGAFWLDGPACFSFP